MKLCVIGNSHAAMILSAHKSQPDMCQLTVFARPSMEDGDIVLEGTILRPNSAEFAERLAELGTPAVVDLRDFDAIVFTGMTASMFTASQFLQAHMIYGWPATQSILEQSGPAARQVLSLSAYQVALAAIVAQSQTGRLCALLAKQDIAPVFVIPQPYPSVRVLSLKGKSPILKRLQRDEEGTLVAAELERMHHHIFDPMPGIEYLPQPEETIEHGFLTRSGYNRNAVRLNVDMRQSRNDILHTNAAYGKLYLDKILSAIN